MTGWLNRKPSFPLYRMRSVTVFQIVYESANAIDGVRSSKTQEFSLYKVYLIYCISSSLYLQVVYGTAPVRANKLCSE